MKYLALILSLVVINAQVVMNPYRFGVGSVENNNLLPQLLAFYSLDEAFGHAVDSNTNAYHLTQVGTVATNTGKIDGCRNFAGLNYFSTNNAVWANLDTNDFTIGIWFQPHTVLETFTALYMLASGDFNSEFNWAFRMTEEGGNMVVQFVITDLGDTLQVQIGSPLPAAGWHFAYVRRDGDDFDMGVAVPGSDIITTTDTLSSPGFDVPYVGTDFAIGAGLFNGSPIADWEGDIDHVGFWQRALSECEILKLVHLRKHSQFDSDACN